MSRLPGPRALPLLGATGGLIRFFANPVRSLLELRTHGEVVSLAAPDPSLVAAFGPAHNSTVLSDPRRFHHFAEPMVKAPPEASMNRITRGLTAMNGEQHRLHRRLLQPAFSRTAIEGYAAPAVEVAERFLQRWKQDEVRDLRADMVELSLLVSMRCLFGLEVESEAKQLGRLGMQALSGLTDARIMAFPVDLPGSPLRRYKRVCEEMERSLRSLIARRSLSPEGPDALSILLRAHDADDGKLTDDELVGHANVLFVAGHETTACTLAWTLLLLSAHPQVAADLQDELQRVLGGDLPTAAKLDELPLLDRVVRESMRLLPATPFLFPRVLKEPIELGGHAIPAGAKLVLSPLITHREPSLFPDPLRFEPRRWEGASYGPHAYLPFGAGARMCLGSTFATQTIRLVLALILSRHRLTLVPGTKVRTRCHGITMGPRDPVPMRLSSPAETFVGSGLEDGLEGLVEVRPQARA